MIVNADTVYQMTHSANSALFEDVLKQIVKVAKTGRYNTRIIIESTEQEERLFVFLQELGFNVSTMGSTPTNRFITIDWKEQ